MRILLLLLGGSCTFAAAVAAAEIVREPPLTLEIAGRTLFTASLAEVLVLWGLVALGTAIPFLRARVRRRKAWVVFLVCFAAILVWVTSVLLPRRSATEVQAGTGDVPARDRTTLLVAVDGMSWTAILPMVRRGELPTIAHLMNEGTYGVLHSLRSYRPTIEKWGYWSPVVWTSMATGVGPQRHGIVDFEIEGKPGQPRIAASYHRTEPALWNLFSAFDRRVAIVGWWCTWPAEEVSGYLVSNGLGLLGKRSGLQPDRGLTHPPGLVDRLPGADSRPEELHRWIEEEVFPFDSYPVLSSREMRTARRVIWQDRLHRDVTRHLIEEGEPVDLYAVYFEGIDVLSHYLWAETFGEADRYEVALPQGFEEHHAIVPTYYRIIDSYLGDLLEVLPEDVTMVLASDHGFRLDDENAKGATHSRHGVILLRGPGIAAGRSLNLDLLGSAREAFREQTDVLDVLPTLLYLHGLPVADDLPGTILHRALTRRFLAHQPLLEVRSYGRFASDREVDVVIDEEASDEYRDTLRALGYIQ